MSSLALLAVAASQIGTNVHLPPSDVLDLAVDLGGQWVRIDLNWDLAQPAPDQFDWQPFDAVIDAARARGLNVYATLGYTPAWASTGDRRGDGAHNDVPVAGSYRVFVEAAVARYRTKVGIFGTWNEPNLADFFEGSRDEWLANIYRPGVQGIRAACPACVVAGPEVATIGDAYDDYIRVALQAEVPTVLSAHIYSAFPEDDSDAGFGKDSFYNKLEHRRVIGPFQGTPSIRETAVDAGQGALPIWITETGREATVGDAGALAAQQRYVQRVLDAMETRPWWAGTIIYELTEEHPGGAFPDIHWGLALRTADPDGTPLDNFERKPAFDYLKMRLAAAPPMTDAGVPGDASSPGDDGGPPNANGDAGTTGEVPGAPGGCCSGSRGGASAWLAFGVLGYLVRRRPAR